MKRQFAKYALLSCVVASILVIACSPDSVSPPPPPPSLPPPPPGPPGYDVIDLGTLGGNDAVPVALNDNGQVVGRSATADGREHAFLWENGVMRDLSSPGDLHSAAQAISNSGVIAGYVSGSDGRPGVVVWKNGAKTELGSVGSIDEQIGVVALTNEDVVAWGYRYDITLSAIWQSGAKRSLGGLPGATYAIARAKAMNNRRRIVGSSISGHLAGSGIQRAFIWDNGAMRELKSPYVLPCGDDPAMDCTRSSAVDIANDGTVIGYSTVSATRYEGLRWVNGSAQTLGFEAPVAINDAGDIAGNSSLYSGGEGVFWRAGTVTRFGSLGGGGTHVVDMNELGMVTGASLTPDGKLRAFVWKLGQSQPTDLGAGPQSGAEEESGVTAINSRGDIIGWTGRCNEHAYGTCFQWADRRAILWKVVP